MSLVFYPKSQRAHRSESQPRCSVGRTSKTQALTMLDIAGGLTKSREGSA